MFAPIDHPTLHRRGFLKLAGLGWLTPISRLLADQAERSREPARSVIFLWLQGGPSQLETFDPHPDSRIAAGTRPARLPSLTSSSPKASSAWPTA